MGRLSLLFVLCLELNGEYVATLVSCSANCLLDGSIQASMIGRKADGRL